MPPLHEQAKAEDPSFKTPEEIAAEEVLHSEEGGTVVHHEQNVKHTPHGFMRWLPHTKKQKILYSALAVVLICSGGAGWVVTHRKPVVVAEQPRPIIKAAPQPIYSNLSGLPITDASLNSKPVTAVMIENSLDARPQSGLADAGVVFEAVAEGGVTRFMALFQDIAPDNIGPVRSARPYYISWEMGFDAAYAHAGGSDAGLQDIKDWGVKDINLLNYNSTYAHRVSSRPAPHNLYSSIPALNELEASKGYTSTFTGFPRKSDQPYKAPVQGAASSSSTSDTRTPATSIGFWLSGPIYDPHFDYNAATNSYDRSENGQPHVDANGNKRISPKVVVAMVVPLARGALDSSGAYYSDYTTVGSGTAYIFQDGTVVSGKWSKAANNAQITFTDSADQPLSLNRGQTWISAVSATNAVSYK